MQYLISKKVQFCSYCAVTYTYIIYLDIKFPFAFSDHFIGDGFWNQF